jgi:dTDP-L-rhamnose 4-epimerase
VNILITGGAGFIGSNLSLKLLEKGHSIRVLDSLSPQIHGLDPQKSPLYASVEGKVDFIHGSVTLTKDWIKAIEGMDAIIHLAAETGTGQSMYEIEKYVDVNVKGTALMLDLLTNRQHNVKKIVVASSRAIYGEGLYNCQLHGDVYPNERLEVDMSQRVFECKCPICGGKLDLLATREDSKIHPTSIYGITKQIQEQMVLLVGKSLGIDAVSFRYQNVYGPGQSLSNPYTGILSVFSTQIKNGNDINIFEDGLESRDFVYIDDVVDATILGLEKSQAAYKAFNVGADTSIDVITVAKMLQKNFASGVKINVSGNYRIGDIRHNYADITLAKEILGYSPKIDFSIGISRFCKWVNSQAVQQDRYADSIEEMKKKGLYK